ncbi:DDE transposase family protein [Rivularia sp. UHCC 0363]|uniref:DDE transposase family protein n=1 Tax=Rivularia sp. UHCC 0363 TaxID=3110244 RepID=UPI002B201F57|nr:DDE transposase family protein [Rivularia sp. UHCC 0363]MEA5595921.1 DDE transposase family protein [Rivularia sp. UHCC 0363]
MSGYIDKHPEEAQRLVGLNFEKLKQLIRQAIALRTQSESEAELKKTRIIKKGGGRKTKLYDGRTNITNSNIFATIDNISIVGYSVRSK